jgi:hypothetical protein
MPVIKAVKFLLCIFFLLSFFTVGESNPNSCAAGKQVLWYYPEPDIDDNTFSGFSNQLFTELSSPLADLGYCLKKYDKKDTTTHSQANPGNQLMRVACESLHNSRSLKDGKNQTDLFVHLTSITDLEKGGFNFIPIRPLVSFSFSPEDIGSILIIFSKKIIENLRTEFICNLMISSDPSGVAVSARDGLSDVTPFEWVVPVGKLFIQCKMKDYLTYKKEINMDRPGVYNYFIQLKKKQFYNSKFFIPSIACGLAAAACYGSESYFYSRYENFGKAEHDNNPGIFARTFSTAQAFERLGASFLGIGCFFFGLSIWF